MVKSKLLMPSLLGTGILLSACGTDNNLNEAEESINNNNSANTDVEIENDAETIHIMTTLYSLEFFANEIGGEIVEVENMVPPGGDAHTFEPTANQMIDVAEADLFIYNGAGFEGFAESVQETVENHDVEILKAVEGIELLNYDHDHAHDDDHGHDDNNNDHGHDNENNDHGHDENNNDHGHDDENNGHGHDDNNTDHGHDNENNDHGHDDAHGDGDPHVWLDPLRAVKVAENIKEALIDVQPGSEEIFTENFEQLKAELEELDEEFKVMADGKNKDTIIVSHAGYGYWEDRYGIHQIGIAGISPSNEPSIQQIQDVIAHMEENSIGYVMFEQNIPVSIAETVRDETDSEALWLHNLEALTEEDIENNEDYFSLMRQNIEALEKALN